MKIKLYYYTAKNGYAWQGCSDEIANSLQRYMEAVGALPIPTNLNIFGGATVCQIVDEMGVAVYRYHTIEKGDNFGRDCNLIALAFIPIKILSNQKVAFNFKSLLNDDSLALPDLTKGELQLEPNFSIQDEDAWIDKSCEWSFSGKLGLSRVSQLFFSETTQLGLLTAEFHGDVDRCEAIVSYKTFREVDAVRDALAEYDLTHRQKGGYNIETLKKLEEALSVLKAKRVERLKDYNGLRRYYSEISDKINGYSIHIDQIKLYQQNLDEVSNKLSNFDKKFSYSGNAPAKFAKDAIKELIKIRENVDLIIMKVPVLECQEYRAMLDQSFKIQKEISYKIGKLVSFELVLNLGEKINGDGINLVLKWLKNDDNIFLNNFQTYFNDCLENQKRTKYDYKESEMLYSEMLYYDRRARTSKFDNIISKLFWGSIILGVIMLIGFFLFTDNDTAIENDSDSQPVTHGCITNDVNSGHMQAKTNLMMEASNGK